MTISDGGNAALAVLFTGGQFEEIPYVLPPVGNDLDRVPGAPYNLDPSNPFAARFSNGPVWVEQLSARFGMLLLPSLAGSGWLPVAFIDEGPFGIALLKPYALFGLTGLDPITHSLFWTMLVNIGALVGISLLTEQSALERTQAALFVDALENAEAGRLWRGTAKLVTNAMLFGTGR